MIAPSILAADFARLAEAAAAVRGEPGSGADWLHVDVMDAHFVPNLTIGLPVVTALRAATDLPLDCHLMIDDPDRWAPAYVEAGAGSVTFHVEAATAPVRLARELRAQGARAGMALRPATPVEPYEDLLPELDMVLVMTVEPGFGGQKLMPDVLPKAAQLRAMGFSGDIEADGGINGDNAPQLAQAGIDTLVMGTAFFRAEEPEALVRRVHSL